MAATKSKKNNVKTIERSVVAGVKSKGAAPGKSKPQKAPKVARAKKTSALDAAAIVLKKAGKPMRAQELVAAMSQQGLWTSPGGKTPQATLYAAMIKEINTKHRDARFQKVERGQFAYKA